MNTKQVSSLLFILLIAVVFTLQFGPGSSGCGRLTPGDPNAVAVVNGVEISATEYRQAYASQLNRLRQAGIPESQARLFGMPQQTLNGLVDSILLAQAAKKAGVVPSDEDVRELLFQIQAFHDQDGKFDYERYKTDVRQRFNKTPQGFEQELRDDIASQRMLALVTESAAVSEAEVKARFFREEDQAGLTFVRFQPSQFTAQVQAPTPEELQAFKQQSAEAIKSDYDQNQFVYQQPERIKARQILVKYPADATPEQKAAAQTKAADLKKQLAGGADFAKLAEEASDDQGTKAKGGDLGWVERGGWDPALADAAFPLKAGEITEPTATNVGVHLVKVEEKQAPQKKELAQVEDEIARKLWNKERAKTLARQAAEGALAQAKTTGKSLAELFPKVEPAEGEAQNPFAPPAGAQTPQASEVAPFPVSSDFVPTLGPAPELVKAARAVTEAPKLVDQVVNVGEAFVVTQVTLRKQPTEADFAAKKDEFRDQALEAKKMELRDQYLKTLREQGDVQTNPETVDRIVGQG